jgi:xanthine dehydrogenase accessory factor
MSVTAFTHCSSLVTHCSLMVWLEPLVTLSKNGEPFVIVTIIAVRGHAPRGAGTKMVVSKENVYGSVGGGNLEQTAINESRRLLFDSRRGDPFDKLRTPLAPTHLAPTTLAITLNPNEGEYGVQCCGGEVTLLFEPMNPMRPTVAIFGAGHVGWSLVHVLSMLPIDIYVVDSRLEQLESSRLPASARATINLHHADVPESMISSLPSQSHLLVLTHDHAEDIATLDVVLRRDDIGFIGLIGSSAKWAHFQQELKKQGHSDESLKRVTTPIGLASVPGKSPQAIAIATAAQLLSYLDLPEQNL